VADKASCCRATPVQRRGSREKRQAAHRHDMATAVSEYEVSRPAQRIESDNQALTRLVLGWCSRSVRGPEPGGLVRGGVMASEALSCHLAEKKHRASRYSWPSPTTTCFAAVDREGSAGGCYTTRMNDVLLVDIRASTWLADVDAFRAAAADPRQPWQVLRPQHDADNCSVRSSSLKIS
jgi:hypothetical protein